MFRVEELRDYLARPGRAVALIDRRYWRDFQRELPPDLVVLETISIQDRSRTSCGAAPRAPEDSLDVTRRGS